MIAEIKAFEGKEFHTNNDPTIVYTYLFIYESSGTPIIVGQKYDSLNNRSEPKTFKLTDVKFVGRLV
jgi:hypothetical protein